MMTVEHDDQPDQIKSPICHYMPLDLALAKSEARIN